MIDALAIVSDGRHPHRKRLASDVVGLVVGHVLQIRKGHNTRRRVGEESRDHLGQIRRDSVSGPERKRSGGACGHGASQLPGLTVMPRVKRDRTDITGVDDASVYPLGSVIDSGHHLGHREFPPLVDVRPQPHGVAVLGPYIARCQRQRVGADRGDVVKKHRVIMPAGHRSGGGHR